MGLTCIVCRGSLPVHMYLGKVKWEVQGEAFKHFILDWILQQARATVEHVGEVDYRGFYLQIGIGLTVCWHVKQISSLVSRPCKGQGSDLGVVGMAPADHSHCSKHAAESTVCTCSGVGHTMTNILIYLNDTSDGSRHAIVSWALCFLIANH